jgi:hypothetical protein
LNLEELKSILKYQFVDRGIYSNEEINQILAPEKDQAKDMHYVYQPWDVRLYEVNFKIRQIDQNIKNTDKQEN